MHVLKTCRHVGAPVFVALLSAGPTTGCSRAIAPLAIPGSSAIALTGGPNTSMIYVARTSDGVLAIDLGWWGHGRSLQRALGQLGAVSSDVRVVFLTHSHRDHISAWSTLKHSRFHFAEAERQRLLGKTFHGGWIPRWADRIKPTSLPRAGQIEMRTFVRDTAFAFGADTLRAFVVAGHTPGSAAYLFRGILFLGDAVTYSRRSGFRAAKRGFSDDTRIAATSLAQLWSRLPAGSVRFVCTAHAHCAPIDERFVSDVAR